MLDVMLRSVPTQTPGLRRCGLICERDPADWVHFGANAPGLTISWKSLELVLELERFLRGWQQPCLVGMWLLRD